MAQWTPEQDRERQEQLKAQAAHTLQHGKSVTLERSADFYRERSTDRTLPKRERDLWKQLADEADTRLGRNAPPSKQEQLF